MKLNRLMLDLSYCVHTVQFYDHSSVLASLSSFCSVVYPFFSKAYRVMKYEEIFGALLVQRTKIPERAFQ